MDVGTRCYVYERTKEEVDRHILEAFESWRKSPMKPARKTEGWRRLMSLMEDAANIEKWF